MVIHALDTSSRLLQCALNVIAFEDYLETASCPEYGATVHIGTPQYIHVTPLSFRLHIFSQEQVPLLNWSLFNIYTATLDIGVLGVYLVENNGNYYSQV